MVREQNEQITLKEHEVEQAKKEFEARLANKEAQVKNLELAQQISHRRLQQAEGTMNELLANPLTRTSSQDTANDAKIKELTQQLDQES